MEDFQIFGLISLNADICHQKPKSTGGLSSNHILPSGKSSFLFSQSVPFQFHQGICLNQYCSLLY